MRFLELDGNKLTAFTRRENVRVIVPAPETQLEASIRSDLIREVPLSELALILS